MDSYLDPSGARGANPSPVWPQIYRLQGEKYVPASKDFPEYYQTKVLPQLDKRLAGMPPSAYEETLVMQRDKILRVLGIDPTAGLAEARQWAQSDDPNKIYNAWCVFHDIPGHQAEANAAWKAWGEALHRRLESNW